MDFFEHQDLARRNTRRLVVLMIIAVICIIALVYLVVAGTVVILVGYSDDYGRQDLPSMWNPALLFVVGGVVIAIVLIGSLARISQLRAGGRVVAEALNGQLVDPNTRDRDERKLLNVVEEMAIASGTPVPPVYVMNNEASINAFAAGYSVDDAVVGVTRGCIAQLSRDELQGVIAHEFSHILNGDMRLNIRLIGILNGILIIGLLGHAFFRSTAYAGMMGGRRRTYSSSRGGKGDGGAAAVLVIMLAAMLIMIIGYVGVFFGNLIKAAVSRQREFLADAAAVQYTRNPDGIAGALKRIGGYVHGSKMQSPQASEASHMFFGDGMTHWFGSMMATHPPLPQRIKRVDPSWDGVFPAARAKPDPEVHQPEHPTDRPSPFGRPTRQVAGMAALAGAADAATPRGSFADHVQHARQQAMQSMQAIGRPTAEHVAHARALIQRIPAPLREAAHEPFGARAVVYQLLLDEDARIRQAQLQRLERHADPAVYRQLQLLQAEEAQLPGDARLPLLDMCIPALKELSPRQYVTFRENVEALIRADDRVNVFEWMLRRLLLRHLEPHFTGPRDEAVRYHSLKSLMKQVSELFSTLAYVGHADVQAAQHAFDQALQAADLPAVPMTPAEQCSLRSLGEALDTLVLTSMQQRKRLIAGCIACIGADEQITQREAELLRATCDSLDCPMPPILPGPIE